MSNFAILVAHGSSHPSAAPDHVALCERVGNELVGTQGAPDRLVAAFLSINHPSIEEAIDEAVSQGASSVSVVPYFLNPGNHVLVDIPQIVASSAQRHPGLELTISPHLGADPRLAAMLSELIMDQSGEH